MSGRDLRMKTSDGVEIVYDDEGDGSSIVLVHGYDGFRQHWEFQRDVLLAAGHRVVALDLRCHGASDKPQHGQRVARLGQDVRELLESLDLEDVTLVAHSMGVSVSLAMFSISGFDRISRFVAIDQSPKIINEDGWPWGIHKVTWDNAYEGACLRADWGHYEREPILPEGCSMAWSTDAFDHESVRRLLIDHFVSDWRDVLSRIPFATWVVAGGLEPYYHRAGMEWFAAEIPQGKLTMFEGSGHSPHVSEATEFNAMLLAFAGSKS
jgi:non-heme chloroperoxidase